MEQVNMIGMDLAKNSFQLHSARVDGPLAFRKKLSRGKLLDFIGCATTLHGDDGGVRRRVALGPGDRQSRPCGAPGSADLRQSVGQAGKERRVGRGGDLRGVVEADHALCGCSGRAIFWCASALKPSMRCAAIWRSSVSLFRKCRLMSAGWTRRMRIRLWGCRKRSASWAGFCLSGSPASMRRLRAWRGRSRREHGRMRRRGG